MVGPTPLDTAPSPLRTGRHAILEGMSTTARGSETPTRQQVSAGTLRRLELASGGLATASINAMERRLPWFQRLPADQRASVLLVTQTGVTNFVAWLQDPTEAIRLTA